MGNYCVIKNSKSVRAAVKNTNISKNYIQKIVYKADDRYGVQNGSNEDQIEEVFHSRFLTSNTKLGDMFNSYNGEDVSKISAYSFENLKKGFKDHYEILRDQDGVLRIYFDKPIIIDEQYGSEKDLSQLNEDLRKLENSNVDNLSEDELRNLLSNFQYIDDLDVSFNEGSEAFSIDYSRFKNRVRAITKVSSVDTMFNKVSLTNDKSERLNTESLKEYLSLLEKKFNIPSQFLSNDEFVKMFGDNVNAAFKNGTAYFNTDKVITKNIAAEEILHPVIHHLKSANKKLFNDLVDEARKTLPNLVKEIENTYTDNVEEEIVTQTLTRFFNGEIDSNKKENKSLIDKIKEFIRNILDQFSLGKKLLDFYTSKNNHPLSIALRLKNRNAIHKKNGIVYVTQSFNYEAIKSFSDLANFLNNKNIKFEDFLKSDKIERHSEIKDDNGDIIDIDPLKVKNKGDKEESHKTDRRLEKQFKTRFLNNSLKVGQKYRYTFENEEDYKSVKKFFKQNNNRFHFDIIKEGKVEVDNNNDNSKKYEIVFTFGQTRAEQKFKKQFLSLLYPDTKAHPDWEAISIQELGKYGDKMAVKSMELCNLILANKGKGELAELIQDDYILDPVSIYLEKNYNKKLSESELRDAINSIINNAINKNYRPIQLFNALYGNNKYGINFIAPLCQALYFDSCRISLKKRHNIYNNFDAFFEFGFKHNPKVRDMRFISTSNTINDKEDDAETENNIDGSLGLDTYLEDAIHKDYYVTMSSLLKNALGQLYKIDKTGRAVSDEISHKELGLSDVVTNLNVWFAEAGVETYDDMINLLREKAKTFPWVRQIYGTYTVKEPWSEEVIEKQGILGYDDENGKHVPNKESLKDGIPNRFFSTFRNFFKIYSVDHNGRVYYKNKRNFGYWYLNVVATKLGKADEKDIESQLNAVFLDKNGDEKIRQDFFNKTLGLNIKIEDINALCEKYKYFFKRAFIDNYGNLKQVFIEGVKQKDDIVLKLLSSFFTEAISKSDEKIDAIFYDDGKMYNSFCNLSWLNKASIAMTHGSQKMEEFINKTYKDDYLLYDKLGKNDHGEVDRYHCDWINESIDNGGGDKVFEFTQVLSYNDVQYAEKTSAQLLYSQIDMFWSGMGGFTNYMGAGLDQGGRTSWYAVPIESDKDAEEYVRGYVYDPNEIPGKIINTVFKQEVKRMRLIKKRGNKSVYGNLNKRGKDFLFLDYLNKYRGNNIDVDYIYDELNKDLDFQDDVFKHKRLEKERVSKEDIKTVNKFIESVLSGDDSIEIEVDQLKALEKIIQAELFLKFNDMLKVFNSTRIISKNENGEWQWNRKDLTIKKALDEFSEGRDREEELIRLLQYIYFNSVFAKMNIIQMTVTDPAFLKDDTDFQKRMAQVHAPGLRFNTVARDKFGNRVSDGYCRSITFNDEFGSVKKDIKFILNTLKKRDIDNYIKHEVESRGLKDLSKKEKDKIEKEFDELYEKKLESYETTQTTDGQAFISFSGMRKKMIALGKWQENPLNELVFWKYQSVRHHEKDEYGNPITLSVDDYKAIQGIIKDFVFSHVNKEKIEGTDKYLRIPIQHKNSEYMLMECALWGEGSKLKEMMDLLEDSHFAMDENGNTIVDTDENGKEIRYCGYKKYKTVNNGIDTINFSSAVKVGSSGVLSLEDSIDDVKQKIYSDGEYNKYFVDEYEFDDYMWQQNVPNHLEEKSLHGSQVRILSIADIDRLVDEHGEVKVIKSTSPGGKLLTLDEAREEYFELLAVKSNLMKKQFFDSLNIGQNKGLQNITLSNMLIESLITDASFSPEVLASLMCDDNGEFLLGPSDPSIILKIENMLYSKLKKNTIKMEMDGGTATQVTNFGTTKNLNVRYKDRNGNILQSYDEFVLDYFKKNSDIEEETDDVLEELYQKYIDENMYQLAYYEVYVSPYSKKFYNKEYLNEETGEIDINKIPEKDLMMIGYRIPTEYKYSMIPMKVVGFLPKIAGDAIMMPKELTAQTGSDFDVDKIFLMRHSDKIDAIGMCNDCIFDLTYQFLTYPTTASQFAKSQDYDILKDKAKIYDKKHREFLKDNGLSIDETNHVYMQTHVKFHQQNMVAKQLIAVFASSNVAHAFTSLVNDDLRVMNISQNKNFRAYGRSLLSSKDKNSMVSFDNQYDSRWNRITENIGKFLAAAVDGAKSPTLGNLNINMDNVNLCVTMLRLGYTIEETLDFFNKNCNTFIIQQYNDYKTQHPKETFNSYISKLKNAVALRIDDRRENRSLNELVSTSFATPDSAKISNEFYTEEGKEDWFTLNDDSVDLKESDFEKMNSDEKSYLLFYLHNLSTLQNIYGELSKITNITKTNSLKNALGNTVARTFDQLSFLDNMDENFDEKGNPKNYIGALMNNPFLKANIINQMEINDVVIKGNLVTGMPSYKTAVELLRKFSSRRLTYADYNRFEVAYISYFINSKRDGTFLNKFFNRDDRLNFETTFPHRFAIMIEALAPLVNSDTVKNFDNYIGYSSETLSLDIDKERICVKNKYSNREKDADFTLIMTEFYDKFNELRSFLTSLSGEDKIRLKEFLKNRDGILLKVNDKYDAALNGIKSAYEMIYDIIEEKERPFFKNKTADYIDDLFDNNSLVENIISEFLEYNICIGNWDGNVGGSRSNFFPLTIRTNTQITDSLKMNEDSVDMNIYDTTRFVYMFLLNNPEIIKYSPIRMVESINSSRDALREGLDAAIAEAKKFHENDEDFYFDKNGNMPEITLFSPFTVSSDKTLDIKSIPVCNTEYVKNDKGRTEMVNNVILLHRKTTEDLIYVPIYNNNKLVKEIWVPYTFETSLRPTPYSVKKCNLGTEDKLEYYSIKETESNDNGLFFDDIESVFNKDNRIPLSKMGYNGWKAEKIGILLIADTENGDLSLSNLSKEAQDELEERNICI